MTFNSLGAKPLPAHLGPSINRPLLWLLLIAGVLPALANDFYVAPNGNDANPGTSGKPFATLERARDEIRPLVREGKLPPGGLTIWVRGGDYFRTNTFELTSADRGTAGAPITWRAARGETVRLLGGRKLPAFTPVTDAAILNRLPEGARTHVVQLDLRAAGISDLGEARSRGFGRGAQPSHCELFYDGRPMTPARWPNEGEWARIAGWPDSGGATNEWGSSVGKLENGFLYAGDRPRAWKDISDLWVHGYWAWDWANSYERVASLDLEHRVVKTAPPYGLYNFRKGQRFFFFNVLEELDQPGEWFLDRQSAMLYFWPPAVSGSPGSAEALFSQLAGPLLRLRGVSHVTLRGLILEATRGSAIEIQGGDSDLIAGCVLRNIGDYGVTITGGLNHGVQACDLFDTGDGGVSLEGGDRKTLLPGGHFVENCHFARQGRWSKCYVPAILMNGVGLRASHNLIHDHPHCAILFNGNEQVIEFNEIYRYALETGDVGAIYTGRDYSYRGNHIRYNFLHGAGGVGMGSMGVYMDDCVSGTEIYGNVFYQVERAAFLGGGRDHQVINNIFVDCKDAVELDGRGVDQNPVWRSMVDTTMRQSLAALPQALYRERYPAIKSLDQYYGPPGGPALQGAAFHGVPPENDVAARNVCVGNWLKEGWGAKAGSIRQENNLTNAAGWFARSPGTPPRPGDFALLEKCPAFQLGFEPIPLDRIGLYQDELRAGLPGPAKAR